MKNIKKFGSAAEVTGTVATPFIGMLPPSGGSGIKKCVAAPTGIPVVNLEVTQGGNLEYYNLWSDNSDWTDYYIWH